jgi:hypothetical protein
MALGAMETRAAQRHALEDVAVVADLCRLSDHDTHSMIDEQSLAYRRTGMDLDPGDEAAEVRDRARDDRHAGPVKGVGQAVEQACVKARIRQNDFDGAAGSRIAVAYRAYVTID